MNYTYILNTKRKINARAEKLMSCKWDYFQASLRAYFDLFETDPLLKEIMTSLKKEKILSADEWLQSYHRERMPHMPDNSRQQAAQSLELLEAARKGEQRQAYSEFVIDSTSSSNLNDMKDIFVENIFTPFNSYVIENLDDGGFNEFVLTRYKISCEWYRHEELRRKIAEEQKRKDSGAKKLREFEKILTADAVNFLFLNGLTPISLSLGNCKPDITTDIFSVNPLVTEIKVFVSKEHIPNLQGGIRQVNQALSTTQLSTGFLIVFNIGTMSLKILNDVQEVALQVVVVNITEVPPNRLKETVEVKMSELLKNN